MVAGEPLLRCHLCIALFAAIRIVDELDVIRVQVCHSLQQLHRLGDGVECSVCVY